ncbi:hypothetical protein E3N88_19976 [Mikania micrantha]|uniref:Uncharacterized protein n=1 Tax=Mikania micrantha TaxID=192012 RepID=A0A5N6NG66_9ASTR|nr:hypothetical protein E3N88_19976 [Mikania micrantha]
MDHLHNNNVCEMESSPSSSRYQKSRIDYLAFAKDDTDNNETLDIIKAPTGFRVTSVVTHKTKKTRQSSPSKSASLGKPIPNKKPGSKLTDKKNEKTPNNKDPRQYDEAIPIIERSIELTNIHVAKFTGCMQLGDTYAMQGNIERSILCYKEGLEIQKHVLGEHDARFGETCRYVAEAHVQAMQFDEAKKLYKMAIDIHGKNGTSNSLEEAADRRLMGLICYSTGNYETAIDHYLLARMAMSANGHDWDAAAIDGCVGDVYLSLARYDEAILSYGKALNVFRWFTKEESHSSVAWVYVRLADVYNKMGRFGESETYCEKALRIYLKPKNGKSMSDDEIAKGLVEVSGIYESMKEVEGAVELLKKAYERCMGEVARVEAQMGVLYYMMGSYKESYGYLKATISKQLGVGKSGVLGIALNQMKLACLQMESFDETAHVFEEAKGVLETIYGPHHPNTLGVEDAIEILEYVVGMREEKLGTADADVDNQKRWLAQLLKDTSRNRSNGSRSLEFLLHAT